VQEEVLELPVTDSADTAPAQGKPGAWPLFLIITVCVCVYIYIYVCVCVCVCVCVVHLRYRNFMETTGIYMSTLWVLLVQHWVATMFRFIGSVGNLSLLTNRWILLVLS
jgi:heme/copper-type cytochrome/quinol oxidase subunit 2